MAVVKAKPRVVKAKPRVVKAKPVAEYRPAPQKRRYRHDSPTATDLFCVDEQTEILTAAGWRRYDQLAAGDVALTIRPDGTAAEWQPVEAVNVFPAEPRKMQLIEGRGMSALTTDNHRWLARRRTKTYLGGGRRARRYGPGPYRLEFRRSDELTVDHSVPMAAPVANLPNKATVPDPLVELVAWYWTEGTDRAHGRVHIVQDHTVNPQHVAAIRAALVDLYGPEREKWKRQGGPLWAENRWGNQTTFGLNRAAADALRKAAPGKVPAVEWLATLTQRQLGLFIQRSLDADGRERTRGAGRTERVLTQGDRERASAFQAACLIAGHAASMKQYESTYRHGGTERRVTSWAVTVGMREFVKPLRQKRVDWVEHDGIVWCPTTPNGTWLARRNGTCYFTGNSGFGGLTDGIRRAGFTTINAANHNRYKVKVHERNYPYADHWVADLLNPESSDYHSVRELPPADLLVAGITCTNHSMANTKRAYQLGLTLFDVEDPEFEEQATRSERDRATATCALQYADQHHPWMILLECTTELTSWGYALPGKRKVGDGTTFRWWLKQIENLGYKYKILYLNSQFFGVPQSRDRLYIVFWDKSMRDPDLEHRPVSRCHHCDKDVEAVWTWKTGIPPSGRVCYGQQYNYRCPSCFGEVVPPMTPSLGALDLRDLGTRIGDRPIRKYKDHKTGEIYYSRMARSTMGRAERCLKKFAEFPAVLMPAKGVHGSERHLLQPLATQTSQQEAALLSTGAVIAAHRHNGDGQHISVPMDTVTSTHEKALFLAVDNYQGAPRGAHEPLATQGGSETFAVVSSGVLPYRQNTVPTTFTEAMPSFTADQVPAVMMAAGWYKQNGTTPGHGTAPHPVTDPLGTLTAHDTTALLMAQWRARLGDLAVEDCFYRMMKDYEIGRGCGFDVSFPGHEGSFIVWGTPRDQVDGFGNAVSPPVGEWIGDRMRAVFHSPRDGAPSDGLSAAE